MENLGPVIRQARKAHKLKQKDLAKKVNVKPNYISMIENGHKEPSLDVLKLIALELDLSLDAIFGLAEHKQHEEQPCSMPVEEALQLAGQLLKEKGIEQLTFDKK